MVKIETRYGEVHIKNPIIKVSDLPPSWINLWAWLKKKVTSPHKGFKRRMKRLYRKTMKWQPLWKWLTGVLLGFVLGIIATCYAFHLIGKLLYS